MTSIIGAVVEVLRAQGPLEVFALVAAARKLKPVKKDDRHLHVTGYMGWVQQHLAAERPGTVRAWIVVGKVDEKLEYSVQAIPNLRVKCLRVSLIDPD